MPKNLPFSKTEVRSKFHICTCSLKNSSNYLYLLIVCYFKYSSWCNDKPTVIPIFLHKSSNSTFFPFNYFSMNVAPYTTLLPTLIPIPISAFTFYPIIPQRIKIPPNFSLFKNISFIHLNFGYIPYNSLKSSHTFTDVKTVKVERRSRDIWQRIVMYKFPGGLTQLLSFVPFPFVCSSDLKMKMVLESSSD